MSQSNLVMNGENSCEVKDFSPNTDANINMGAAMKEVSCPKHSESFIPKDGKVGITPYPCDFDHLYASSMSESESCTDKNSEITHLNELLLLHLDLIQQQSEQLVTKDKIISALKQENETLKLRLERMDRRVTLNKQKEPTDTLSNIDNAKTPSLEKDTLPTTDVSHTLQIESHSTPLTVIPETNHVTRRRRRDEKLSVSGIVLNASGPKRRNRSLSCTSSLRSTDLTPSSKVNGGKLIKRYRHQRRERRKKQSCNEDPVAKKEDNILMTDTPYYTPVGDVNTLWNTDETPLNGCVLEILQVPSWRVKIFTSCYTMEGTENLSDDVFDRRHSRLEIDERRRKRWDVQRIREQRQLEKLRQRGRKSNGGSNDEDELVSLWPSPDEAQYLRVQDTLPVAAFGCPITKFNPVDLEFTLPWVNGRDLSRSRPSHGSRKKR